MPLVIIPQIQCKLAERPTGALAAWRGSSPDLGECEEGGSLEFIQRAAPQRREKYRQLRRASLQPGVLFQEGATEIMYPTGGFIILMGVTGLSPTSVK